MRWRKKPCFFTKHDYCLVGSNNELGYKRSNVRQRVLFQNRGKDTMHVEMRAGIPHNVAISTYPKKVGMLDKKTSVIKMGFPETVKLDRLAHNSFT
jgi:hypothetical protein